MEVGNLLLVIRESVIHPGRCLVFINRGKQKSPKWSWCVFPSLVFKSLGCSGVCVRMNPGSSRRMWWAHGWITAEACKLEEKTTCHSESVRGRCSTQHALHPRSVFFCPFSSSFTGLTQDKWLITDAAAWTGAHALALTVFSLAGVLLFSLSLKVWRTLRSEQRL